MVHLAGNYGADGVQRCIRCGYVLTDNRGAMVPDGQAPPGYWAEGAAVEVITGNPKYSGITAQSPDCVTLQ